MPAPPERLELRPDRSSAADRCPLCSSYQFFVVSVLVDNAVRYGRPPLELILRRMGEGSASLFTMSARGTDRPSRSLAELTRRPRSTAAGRGQRRWCGSDFRRQEGRLGSGRAQEDDVEA